jgi:hypothetical protein
MMRPERCLSIAPRACWMHRCAPVRLVRRRRPSLRVSCAGEGVAGDGGVVDEDVEAAGRASTPRLRPRACTRRHNNRGRQTHDRGHRADARGHRLLHEGPAVTHELLTASESFSEPAATSAEYSPRLCPATKSGARPLFREERDKWPPKHVRIAGCVLAVCFRSSSLTRRSTFCEIENPNALSASSKTALRRPDISPPALCPCPGTATPAPETQMLRFTHKSFLLSLSQNFQRHVRLGRAKARRLHGCARFYARVTTRS